ncbi:MAG: carboxypeptidase-like regulatory domain-containing protein, partial [Mangrovimonas sp.]|nr:carboxypeptidase-like regulatory domain-containing protein [Mangrovimonas sp.]
MKKLKLLLVLLVVPFFCLSQTKIGGYVLSTNNEPISYANVIFKGSREGTITNENGKFYLESQKKWDTVIVSFLGYKTIEVPLEKRVDFNLTFYLEEESEQLNEVLIVTGKQPKKNNPAIDLLRKIWAHKRKNGLNMFDQYQYDKYEKVEFDLNTIDSALVNSKFFKGMEFVFDQVDTSRVTGKTYLPIFINESVNEVYGDNNLKKKREILKGNKNSGFSNNQFIIDFVNDLYSDFNVYDNYLKFFDKSFV